MNVLKGLRILVTASVLLSIVGCQSLGFQSLFSSSSPWEKYSDMSKQERINAMRLRRGVYYGYSMRSFLNEKSGVAENGIVFLGDSLVENFPLEAAYSGQNVTNYGVGSDRINGVRERLDICVLDAKPSKVYLMIGLNDLYEPKKMDYMTIEDMAGGYQKLVSEIQLCAPLADVTLFSLLPLTGMHAHKNDDVLSMNKEIKNVAQASGVKYIDLHPVFSNTDGELRQELTVDGVHLSLDGYFLWLQNILEPEAYFQAVCKLMPRWKQGMQESFNVNNIDPSLNQEFPGGRGANQMIIYTPKYKKKTTGTNEWGTEVIVENGCVTKQTVYNSPVPENGFVVSGHGDAAGWMKKYLLPGVYVRIEENALVLSEKPGYKMGSFERKNSLQKKLYLKLYDHLNEKGSDAELMKLKKTLLSINAIDPVAKDAASKMEKIEKNL